VAPPIPDFEGAKVETCNIKVSGQATVDTYDDVIISLDDRVRLVGEYRVVGVRFYVNEKTGETVREQILKPLNLQLCPFDPSDPNDNGIVRARP
jgi:hypothetical protein